MCVWWWCYSGRLYINFKRLNLSSGQEEFLVHCTIISDFNVSTTGSDFDRNNVLVTITLNNCIRSTELNEMIFMLNANVKILYLVFFNVENIWSWCCSSSCGEGQSSSCNSLLSKFAFF